jgi:hypothetical protein
MIDSNAATQERMRRFIADASHELRAPRSPPAGVRSAAHRPSGHHSHAGCRGVR